MPVRPHERVNDRTNQQCDNQCYNQCGFHTRPVHVSAAAGPGADHAQRRRGAAAGAARASSAVYPAMATTGCGQSWRSNGAGCSESWPECPASRSSRSDSRGRARSLQLHAGTAASPSQSAVQMHMQRSSSARGHRCRILAVHCGARLPFPSLSRHRRLHCPDPLLDHLCFEFVLSLLASFIRKAIASRFRSVDREATFEIDHERSAAHASCTDAGWVGPGPGRRGSRWKIKQTELSVYEP